MNDNNARVIQVIETALTRRGTGVTTSPIRTVRQYWSLDGELLAEADPVTLPNEAARIERERCLEEINSMIVSGPLRGIRSCGDP